MIFLEVIKVEDMQRARQILAASRPEEGLRLPPFRQPRKAELLSFVRSQTQTPNGGWKVALGDPEAAAAMRALQRRVRKLDDLGRPFPGAAAEAKTWSYR
ncbi:MAG: hypothetical protein SGPRY_002867 [Prymnesium sp.]